MDQADDLAIEKQLAGRDYLAALASLGFSPNGLLWANDKLVGSDVLVLVTELFDFVGPHEISKTLFKAYALAATPKEIDPFIIRLHSPQHVLFKQLQSIIGARATSPIYQYDPNKRIRNPSPVKGFTFGDLSFYTDWIYVWNMPARAKSVELSRRWQTVSRNIERLAA